MPFPILPPRQREVLALLLQGHSEKQIARRLGLSQHTIHAYCKSLNKAFGAASRGELLAICYRMLLDDARRQPPWGPRPVVELPAVPRFRVSPTEAVRRAVEGIAAEEAPPHAAYSPGC